MDESHYRLIFDNTIEFVGLLDTHGTVLMVNRSALEFAGLSDTQMLTRAAWTTPWFIGETGMWLQDAIARASAGTFSRRDLSIVGAAGQRLDLDFSLRPLHDDQCQVSLILAEGRDISARLQVERDLRESEARHRLVIDTLSEGVVKQRADGTITACNAAAERILGLTKEQMMGRSSLDPHWQAVHEDGSAFPGETHPTMVALHTGEAQKNIVMGVHKPSGELTWILINAQPVYRPNQREPAPSSYFD